MSVRFLRPALALAAAAGLAACSNYGDRGYGYSRVSVGVGYNQPYYGWYDGYYYPGTGYYLYDRYGSRHRWSDRYRNYWIARRPHGRYHDNWDGYRGWDRDGRRWDGDRRGWDRDDRREWREDRREWRQERREDRREWRDDRREDRRERRRDRD